MFKLMSYDPGLFSWLVVLCVLTFVLWNVINLARNFVAARSAKIPTFVSPSNPSSIPWMILGVPLKPLLIRILPDIIYQRIQPTIYGWEFGAKCDQHRRFGDMFFLCTPGPTDLWIAEAEAANDILKRPKDFLPLPGTEVIVGIFGPNLITSHGEQWQKQRRIIAPNFNEGVSELVWNESCSQTTEMLDHFLEGQNGETDETADGLRQIAIHVIGQSAYGMHESWKAAMSKSKQRSDATTMTYVEAVSSIINNLIPAALLPTWVFTASFLPEPVRRIGMAKQRFRHLTEEMLNRERQEARTRQFTRKNLMSVLVALSDAAKTNETPSGGITNSLSEEQISGNLFLLTVAGFDTTANTLAYGIALLASLPKWQEWLFEEVAQYPNSNYEASFPPLLRVRAFLFETLRLYSPLVHIARVNYTPQTLQTSKGPRLIPANTQCYINSVALQSHPATWGEDALTFRPTRWLDEEGELIKPAKGTFLPWSAGPRVCPGMKMAQVEFVAVLTTILSRCKIEVVQRDGESVEGAQTRLWECMQDSQSRLTLQMNRPKDVRLRFLTR